MARAVSPIADRAIVLVDFEAWTDDGTLFDTTRPEVAKKAGMDPTELKGPLPVIIGGGRVVAGFEEAIRNAKVGEETEATVGPEQAFGPRSDGLVRTFPMTEFRKREVMPEPGMRVEMQRRRGTVTHVTASRVKVDFNHPYAGRTITYKFKVEKVLEDTEDKVRALIDLAFRVGTSDDFSVRLDGGQLTITPPERLVLDPAWFLAKHRLAHDVFDHLGVETAVFEDRFTRKGMEAHSHAEHGHGEDAHGHEEE